METPLHRFSPSERLTTILGVAVVLASGLVDIGSEDVRATFSRPTVVYADAPAIPKQRFDVYSLTVTMPGGEPTDGFSAVQKPPQQLGDNVLAGWNILRSATHDALEPGAVTVEPPTTIEIPGITKASDLCDNTKKRAFRAALLSMAATNEDAQASTVGGAESVDNKPIIPVLVVETEGKLSKGCTLTADGGPDAGIVAYHSTYVVSSGMAHELGHTQRLAHDGSDVSGTVKEYGNNGTMMGNNWNYDPTADPDPLTAFDLLALGGIKPEQIVTVPQGTTQSMELSTVASDDGGTVAVRIPVGPLGNSKTDPRLQCATAVYVELDTNAVTDQHGIVMSDAHGISIYAVDERPVPKGSMLHPTVLMPLAPGDYIQSFDTGIYSLSIPLGGTTLRLSIPKLGTDKAQVTVHTTSSKQAATPAVCQ
jgi:hypothetical protein